MKRIAIIALLAVACSLGDRVPVTIDGRSVDIDRCLAPIIKALNDAGIHTRASCCGHGETNGHILLEDRVIEITPQTNRSAAHQYYLDRYAHSGQVFQMRRENRK